MALALASVRCERREHADTEAATQEYIMPAVQLLQLSIQKDSVVHNIERLCCTQRRKARRRMLLQQLLQMLQLTIERSLHEEGVEQRRKEEHDT